MSTLALETIGGLASRLQRREVSAVEVVEAVLAQAAASEPIVNAYIMIGAEAALGAARAADREIAEGSYRGPLHGVPVAIKDNIAVAGLPTTNGSRLWADHVTDFDATIVCRLREAGAIVLGKTAMHEWGMGGTCSRMAFGTVRNPWDPERVPGGSSGGSAAAVSVGSAVAAIGTDGMGSVRTPASYCGVVGLKPTHGLVSRFGDLPPTSSWLHDIGTLSRDVTDAALVLAAIAGPDQADPSSVAPPTGWTIGPTPPPADAAGLRVGRLRGWFEADAVPAVLDALDHAATALTSLGATVVDVEFAAAADVQLVLVGLVTESQSILLPFALDDPTGFASREIRNRILAAEFVRAIDVRRALQLRNRIRREARELMSDLDLLLVASNSTPAFPIGAADVPVGAGRESVDITRRGGHGRLTTRLATPFSLTGQPAITIPAVVRAGELPIGIGLVARQWREDILLRAARALERATTGGYRPPPLARSIGTTASSSGGDGS
jgi:aspartyl-tRNA(Asn)/glutamyl-tRNA(Gln) amidotransferase subunit A